MDNQEVKPNPDDSEKKKKKKKWLLVLLLLLLGIFAGWFFFKGNSRFDFDKNAQSYESPIKKPTDWTGDRIAFPAFKEVRVGENDKEVNMALSNPDFNDAYFKYSLYLDEDSEPFFETGIVKPGQAVTSVTLPEGLKAGEHKVKLETKSFAPGDPKVRLSGANSFFKLTVLKEE